MTKIKKEISISESVSGIDSAMHLSNLNVLNGHMIVKTISIHQEICKAEVIDFGSINPLKLSVGEHVYFDCKKASKIDNDCYVLKFDEVIAIHTNQPVVKESQILVEESTINNKVINDAQPPQAVAPAVNPPAYNVTKSFQKNNKTLPSTGIKHVDKPIRK